MQILNSHNQLRVDSWKLETRFKEVNTMQMAIGTRMMNLNHNF
jgi:hypothetical protein